MYRYGDGTPFPLDENFIETLTTAVETCTNAFLPLAELDTRRDRARDTRKGGDRETAKLADLERDTLAALASYLGDKKPPTSITAQLADKLGATVKATIADSKKQIEARIAQTEAQAAPRTAADGVVKALGPFFEVHTLPKTAWIMSWDARGTEVAADAVATAGRLAASFSLAVDSYRSPIRVDTLAEAVVVHMMRKGMFGKAKPAPIDLGKYVLVAYERTANERVLTLKENANKASPGLRFAVVENGATWVSISATGDAEGEANPLDVDDLDAVRRLADGATNALKDLIDKRRLVDLSLGGVPIADLVEPRTAPFELLAQLTPLARSIRERSRMSGELVLKRDIGDNRREELFVPRATLAQQFLALPEEYRKPFEDMGIASEDTQPAIAIPRPPARGSAATVPKREDKTIEVDTDLEIEK
jgi:hypothetical protein